MSPSLPILCTLRQEENWVLISTAAKKKQASRIIVPVDIHSRHLTLLMFSKGGKKTGPNLSSTLKHLSTIDVPVDCILQIGLRRMENGLVHVMPRPAAAAFVWLPCSSPSLGQDAQATTAHRACSRYITVHHGAVARTSMWQSWQGGFEEPRTASQGSRRQNQSSKNAWACNGPSCAAWMHEAHIDSTSRLHSEY